MKKLNLKSIGIIGGMGPQASAELLKVLVDTCTKDYGARNDEDFPEVILNSVPVPDFISDTKNVKNVLNILRMRVKRLGVFNPVCFGIVCNTAHLVLKDLQDSTNVPFVSIIDEISNKATEAKISRIGLLATPVTINSRLYQKALEEQKIKVVIPSKADQEIVEKVIRNILAGKIDDSDRQKIVLIAESLKQRGAQGIILGCTEIPLIFPKDFPLPIFNSIEILAKALLRKFYERG